MAITPVRLTGWSDVITFLENLRDANNNPYFTSVVNNTTDNTLDLYTSRSGSIPLCKISTSSGNIIYCYDNNGTEVRSGGISYGYNVLSFPTNAYYTSYGALIECFDSVYGRVMDAIGIGKSHEGRTVIMNFYGTGVFDSNTLRPYLHCDDEKPISNPNSMAVWGFQIAGTMSSGMTEYFTALIPLPLNVKSGVDYTSNMYVNLIHQTRGTTGTFSYQGHNYLTNGVFSILDT